MTSQLLMTSCHCEKFPHLIWQWTKNVFIWYTETLSPCIKYLRRIHTSHLRKLLNPTPPIQYDFYRIFMFKSRRSWLTLLDFRRTFLVRYSFLLLQRYLMYLYKNITCAWWYIIVRMSKSCCILLTHSSVNCLWEEPLAEHWCVLETKGTLGNLSSTR